MKLINLFRTRQRRELPRTARNGIVRHCSNSADSRVSAPLAPGSMRNSFRFTGSNRSDFYRYLRDHIPIVSAGIWNWVHLCATRQHLELPADDAATPRAEELVQSLSSRIFPRYDGDAYGLERLTESFFLELFTLGRFAARVHLFPDRSGISHLEFLDPFHIRWKKNSDGRVIPFLEDEDGRLESLAGDLFFYRTLISDLANPQGIEPLASIPFVLEIEQQMLEDMARSSHNAGTPRLQIKIQPPDALPGEDPQSYHERVNGYFERTVGQFSELGPDDNVFTWSDVEVTVIGGNDAGGGIWKLNREQVIEDVITGLKLFPWVLGRSHGTTKNWIFSQYNLLMQIVDSIQAFGGALVEWLIRLELRLAGNPVKAGWQFEANQDPFIVERSRARLLQFDRIDRMVKGGYISLDQGARELGYEKAHRTS